MASSWPRGCLRPHAYRKFWGKCNVIDRLTLRVHLIRSGQGRLKSPGRQVRSEFSPEAQEVQEAEFFSTEETEFWLLPFNPILIFLVFPSWRFAQLWRTLGSNVEKGKAEDLGRGQLVD